VSQFFFFGRVHAEFRQSFAGKTVCVRQGSLHARYMRHRRHFGDFFLGLRAGLRTGRSAGRRWRFVLSRLVLLVIIGMQWRYIQLLLFVWKGSGKGTFFIIIHVLCTRTVLESQKFSSENNYWYLRERETELGGWLKILYIQVHTFIIYTITHQET